MAQALREWQERTGRPAATKVLREAIWFFWQNPRLERPLVNGKYPRAAMWSREAAELALAGPTESRGQLVIEHTEPMHRLLRRLIDVEHSVAELATRLQEGLRVVVVTRTESNALPGAGTASDRYEAAGLSLAHFQSLDEWERVLTDQMPRPHELADTISGDIVCDHMGREWVVADVVDRGMRLIDDQGTESFFNWHGMLTLGIQRQRPAAT